MSVVAEERAERLQEDRVVGERGEERACEGGGPVGAEQADDAGVPGVNRSPVTGGGDCVTSGVVADGALVDGHTAADPDLQPVVGELQGGPSGPVGAADDSRASD